METSRVVFFFITGFFILVLFFSGWMSCSGKRTLSVPTAWGKWKALCIIHRAEGASVTPFPSLCLTLLGLFLISELSPYLCVTGGAGHVLTVLDFHFPGRKRKVVKCSYNVVLEIVSQWRSTFHLFITSSLFPSYLSQSSIFKIPHLLMGAGEADGQRSLCVNKRVVRWMCGSSRSFAS